MRAATLGDLMILPPKNRKFCRRHVSCMFVFGKRISQNKNKIIFGLDVFSLTYYMFSVFGASAAWLLGIGSDTHTHLHLLALSHSTTDWSGCAFDVDV